MEIWHSFLITLSVWQQNFPAFIFLSLLAYRSFSFVNYINSDFSENSLLAPVGCYGN